MKVWILTRETNTGDSEHDTEIESVHRSRAGAEAAYAKAVQDSFERNDLVYGESPKATKWGWDAAQCIDFIEEYDFYDDCAGDGLNEMTIEQLRAIIEDWTVDDVWDVDFDIDEWEVQP